MSIKELEGLRSSLENELQNVLRYWKDNTVDFENGGFYGKIDSSNLIHKKAPKGIILNTRILWSFCRASNFYNHREFDFEIERAFGYLNEKFRDNLHGGVFWEVDYAGIPTNKKKQVYAQAFCLYALTEYYKYSKNPEAFAWANEIFELLEKHAYDRRLGGYFEAFSRTWETLEDVRLSQKDLNAPKTTNTILHVLEAYTNFYEVSNKAEVKLALEKLIQLFHEKLFNSQNHLKLFFTNDWKSLSSEISYGHDIEAAWLVLLACKVIANDRLYLKTKSLLKDVCKTFINEALDNEFGVINSKNSRTQQIDSDRHWWPQAEAMVGLIYNWKLNRVTNDFKIVQQIWQFTEDNIIDHKLGEWYFRVDSSGKPYESENKVGPWKCPYHNTRALIEILELVK
ncbi:N-acylglucosamine 2-epimerase [Muricauda sp. DJ-13]|uniref:Cellobiose 2-epimerase n=1 Tax=Croceivirga thetidis TaxID=2721623 RepID=A0ABX1GWB9_9FLAO|nr:N-acylglucosamine 2-epimerase [Croceivirga thetidis]